MFLKPDINIVNIENKCIYKFYLGLKQLEVVSKPQIRFKGKAQADRENAAYMGVCEHLSEACDAP
jgi:hypothetical protein